MYIRFTTNYKSKDYEGADKLGFLVTASELLNNLQLSCSDMDLLIDYLAWYIDYLEVPDIEYGRYERKTSAWFKASAKEHIERSKDILNLFEKKGIKTETIFKEILENILYEDDYQVVVLNGVSTA